MNIITDLFNDSIINALGWSLFHTLWQGIILAFITGVLIYILRYKSAQIRYLISFLSLVLIVGLSVFHFIHNYDASIQESAYLTNELSTTEIQKQDPVIIDFNNSNENILWSNLTGFQAKIKNITAYFPFIVRFWILGIFIFLLKLVFSYVYTNRLKRSKTINIPERWTKQFERIKEILQINKTIRYIESNLIKTPIKFQEVFMV